MGSTAMLAQEVRRGMETALPGLRKTILRKLPLAVAAMIEARTPNTSELAAVLPIAAERADMREQWLRRLLKNRLIDPVTLMAPFARQALAQAAQGGQTILLAMDQTDLGERCAVLLVSVRTGGRSLPLVWQVEGGAANLGFAAQRALLEQVRRWLPAGAAVMLLADRFYASADLFGWLKEAGWQYRLRLKRNLTVDVGRADVTTTGDLAHGVSERYEPHVHLFAAGVPTAIGVVHDPGHKEPWIIAMDCRPCRAAVLDYGASFGIEPTFSDFKTRGFCLEDTHLDDPERIGCLILIMTLAMYWCVWAGREDAFTNPTPAEKKPGRRPTRSTGRCVRRTAAPSLGLNAACACC
jgi:hypothetical protein